MVLFTIFTSQSKEKLFTFTSLLIKLLRALTKKLKLRASIRDFSWSTRNFINAARDVQIVLITNIVPNAHEATQWILKPINASSVKITAKVVKFKL